MKYGVRVCMICGAEFIPSGRNQKTCKDDNCYKERKRRELNKHRQKKKELSMHGVTKNNSELDIVAMQENLAGISYGKYVLMLSQNKINGN